MTFIMSTSLCSVLAGYDNDLDCVRFISRTAHGQWLTINSHTPGMPLSAEIQCLHRGYEPFLR